MSDIHAETILIVDFGSQYTQLIARRVRESGVYCEIHPYDALPGTWSETPWVGVILSGGPESTTAADAPQIPAEVLALAVPVLGICYGMQALARQLGGEVSHSAEQEFGHAQVSAQGACRLLADIVPGDDAAGGGLNVWMSHGDKVTRPPHDFSVVASSPSAPIAAISFEPATGAPRYGVQFHPEVTHTQSGQALLERFVHEICGAHGLWTEAGIIDAAIAQVREHVGPERVVLGLSGGVDSSVVAALLARAIGDQLTCVLVDNGLLRLGEADEVMAAFGAETKNALPIDIIKVDARDEFMTALVGVDDPEAKRKVIGSTFIDVFEREANKIKGVAWLGQGTIYPDVIESAGSRTGKAHVIKSHHNVGGLPERMHLKLLEPLRELFKDEVRRVGRALGLPATLIDRHPFPGPGLGVRILGEVKPEYADVLRAADHIFLEELRRADLYSETSQAFAVYLPVKSVGVVGDARRYEHVIALRAVSTTDFMTADWAPLPHDFLGLVSRRIINEISGVSRVVYDISSKPPATIEWE